MNKFNVVLVSVFLCTILLSPTIAFIAISNPRNLIQSEIKEISITGLNSNNFNEENDVPDETKATDYINDNKDESIESTEEPKEDINSRDESVDSEDVPIDQNEESIEYYCDLNGDGFVDTRDLDIVIAFWGPFDCSNPNSPDVNEDGIVNVEDLLKVLADWGPCEICCDDCVSDLNCDNIVDRTDINIIVAYWGEDNPILANSPDINSDGFVNVEDLLLVLSNWDSETAFPEYVNSDGSIDMIKFQNELDTFGNEYL